MSIGLVLARATGFRWHVFEQKLAEFAKRADTIGKLRLHIAEAIYWPLALASMRRCCRRSRLALAL